MTTTASPVESIALGLPEDWEELPIDRADFEKTLAEQLARLRELGPPTSEVRRFELLQRQMRDLLASNRVVYAATVASVIRDPASDDEGELVAAATAISISERRDIGAPGPLVVGTLLRGLTTTNDDTDAPQDLDPPARHRLPAGGCVRLARRHRVRVGPGETIDSIAQTYLLPIDGGERLCTLQFVTPNVEHGGGFSELFDSIAKTLRLFREGDPTTFDTPAGADER